MIREDIVMAMREMNKHECAYLKIFFDMQKIIRYSISRYSSMKFEEVTKEEIQRLKEEIGRYTREIITNYDDEVAKHLGNMEMNSKIPKDFLKVCKVDVDYGKPVDDDNGDITYVYENFDTDYKGFIKDDEGEVIQDINEIFDLLRVGCYYDISEDDDEKEELYLHGGTMYLMSIKGPYIEKLLSLVNINKNLEFIIFDLVRAIANVPCSETVPIGYQVLEKDLIEVIRISQIGMYFQSDRGRIIDMVRRINDLALIYGISENIKI